MPTEGEGDERDRRVVVAVLLMAVSALLLVAALVAKLGVDASFRGAQPVAGPGTDAIIETLETVRRGHLERDTGAFLAGAGENWIRVADGEIVERRRADQARALSAYLADTEFADVRFVGDPVVRLSDDGSMAWVAAKVDVCATHAGAPLAFRSAFLHVYRRSGEAWVRAAEANTEATLPDGACPTGGSNPTGADRP